MNEFDRCIDEWAELVAKRNATITALEQRVKELETNMLAATATVASLENRLADVERERATEARVWREALNKVAQDFHDSYRYAGPEIGYIEVQAFLDSRHVHYPECQDASLREGRNESS